MVFLYPNDLVFQEEDLEDITLLLILVSPKPKLENFSNKNKYYYITIQTILHIFRSSIN